MPNHQSAIEFSGLAAQRHRLRVDLSDAVERVLAHGQFILGPEVTELETRLKEYTGVEVITCASGTDALVLAIMGAEIPAGAGVVVPTFTFCATAEAVCLAGAVPVFADVDPATGLLTPATTQAAADAAKRAGLSVRGIVPVELFGQAVDHRDFAALACADQATVVVDAAQSFGARGNGRIALSRTAVSATSFFPAKPLGCYGDGGAVLTADREHAGLLRSLRSHGQGRSQHENVRIGMNSRLDTIQAAVLLTKLSVLEDELAARRRIAAQYRADLASSVGFLEVPPHVDSAYAQFTILVPNRDAVADALRRRGVPSAVYYRTPLHRQPAYSAFPTATDMRGADSLCQRALSIPMHPYLTGADVETIVDSVAHAASTGRG